MPRGDGTGPLGGGGPGSGRGMGRGGKGAGRMAGNRLGAGPVGECVCSNCGTTIVHQPGIPCYQTACPKCGSSMARK